MLPSWVVQTRAMSGFAPAVAAQVPGELEQGAGLVVVQPQGFLQRGDQCLPLGMAGERAGADQGAAPGELLAAHAGEQPAALDVDAGVDERGGQVLGEVRSGPGGR
jgi:hypothetical protein